MGKTGYYIKAVQVTPEQAAAIRELNMPVQQVFDLGARLVQKQLEQQRNTTKHKRRA